MASINLLAPAGNLWISAASCLMVTARVSSGNERRERTCCWMAFSCLLRGGLCWADEDTQPEKTAAISKARIRIVSSVYTPSALDRAGSRRNGVKLCPRSSHSRHSAHQGDPAQPPASNLGRAQWTDSRARSLSCTAFLYRRVASSHYRGGLGRTNGEIAPMSRLRIRDYCPYVSEMTLVPQINPAQARRFIGTAKAAKPSTGRTTR